MSNVINFEEIKLAKQIVADFPQLIENLDKCTNLLYNGRAYYDVALVLNQIRDSKVMMEVLLNGYTQVLQQAKEI